MTENNQNQDKLPTAETQQDVAKAGDAKAEASTTAKASDELTEDDLEAVAGGAKRIGATTFADL